MKTFSKPATIVIAILSVIIAILTYRLYSKDARNLYSNLSGTEKNKTKEISYRDAILCKRKYNELKKGFIQTNGKDPGKNLKDLEGWRLSLKSIDTLRKKGAEELLLIPIMQPESDNNNTPSESLISILIAGIIPTPDDSGKIIFNTTSPSLFFEYLKPCPDNCPKNYYKIFKDTSVH